MNVFYPKIHQVIKFSEQANWDTGYLQGNILQVSYTGCDWSILIKCACQTCQRRVVLIG